MELDVLVIDLEFAHTLSRHNRIALLYGSRYTYIICMESVGDRNNAVLVSEYGSLKRAVFQFSSFPRSDKPCFGMCMNYNHSAGGITFPKRIAFLIARLLTTSPYTYSSSFFSSSSSSSPSSSSSSAQLA